jgi:hypothetical protein
MHSEGVPAGLIIKHGAISYPHSDTAFSASSGHPLYKLGFMSCHRWVSWAMKGRQEKWSIWAMIGNIFRKQVVFRAFSMVDWEGCQHDVRLGRGSLHSKMCLPIFMSPEQIFARRSSFRRTLVSECHWRWMDQMASEALQSPLFCPEPPRRQLIPQA